MPQELFGRQDDLSALTELVCGARNQGNASILLGEPGVGKSMLLHAVRVKAAAQGMCPLTVTGVEPEAMLPFAGLHQLLSPLLDCVGALPQAQQRALMTAVGAEDGPRPEPFIIALAALNLLADTASRRPLLLAVDNVQWLDPPTHKALAFVARRLATEPIVLIGAARSGYHGPLLDAGLPEHELTGLDDDAARALLDVTADDLDPAIRECIRRQARGNPLALKELPVAWRGMRQGARELTFSFLPMTARLVRAFAGRLADMPGGTRDALLIAAMDSVADLSEILAAASVHNGDTLGVSVFEPAIAAGLVHVGETGVRFRHPLVRTGVLQAETMARRQTASGALASVLVNEPHRRTWHRARSIIGPDDDVADELAASHTVALARGSVDSAIWALERSAALTTDQETRGRRLLLAAEHAFGLGCTDRVDRLLKAASRFLLSELDVARLDWLREIFNDGVPGHATRVMELCGIAERSRDAGDADLALSLLLGAALRCWWADPGLFAKARVIDAVKSLPGIEADARYIAVLALAAPVGEGASVVDLLSQVVVENVVDPDTLRLLGMAAHAVGDQVRSIDFLDRSECGMREQGRLGLLTHVLTMGVYDRLELGEFGKAQVAMDESRRMARETGQPIWDARSMVVSAMAAGLRGENDLAQDLATKSEVEANGRKLSNLMACVQLARGLGWVSTGHHFEAYEALSKLFDPSGPSYHETELFHGIGYFADAAVRIGRVPEARTALAELESVATRTNSSTLRVHLAYARAVLAADENADDLYQAALRQDLVRWPLARARIELAYGSWLRRHRRALESRGPLRSAQKVFELIGAPSWAEMARKELRAAGERTQMAGHTVQNVLSVQELQIARLAAEGLSNREIGERLYLSHRTVASHMYRIFPKLNVTSRSQLALLRDLM